MATEEGQALMQEAVHTASEEASRREREAADRRVLAAEKDVLLQSQMCAFCPPYSGMLTLLSTAVSQEMLQHITKRASACSEAISLVPGWCSTKWSYQVLPARAAGGCRRRKEGMKRRDALCATGWLMHLQGTIALS